MDKGTVALVDRGNDAEQQSLQSPHLYLIHAALQVRVYVLVCFSLVYCRVLVIFGVLRTTLCIFYGYCHVMDRSNVTKVVYVKGDYKEIERIIEEDELSSSRSVDGNGSLLKDKGICIP